MDAIIFAAGKGTRLKPYTDTTPKPLLEVVDSKKMIDFVLEALPEEISRVLIIVEHLKEQIESYVHEKNIKKEIIFIEQGSMKGTYGALNSARQHIKSERFLVLNGDDIVSKEGLKKMLNEKRSLGFKKKVMPGYYAVEQDDDNNFLGFRNQTEEEKRNGADIATGTYVLDQRVFDFEPAKISGNENGNEFGLPQMLVPHLADYGIKTVAMPVWHPVNTCDDLEDLRKQYEGPNLETTLDPSIIAS